MTNLLIKVCGLTRPGNLLDVDALMPDMAGMIFYDRSPRYITVPGLPQTNAKRVGVFVDEHPDTILRIAGAFALDYIQLHGDEPLRTLAILHGKGFPLIKAIRVGTRIDHLLIKAMEPYCSYFLLDTQGRRPGGNGKKFDWKLLSTYHSRVPFLLSGGIGPGDAAALCSVSHPAFAGIDLNSGFETSPGIKNIQTLQQFIYEIRQHRP